MRVVENCPGMRIRWIRDKMGKFRAEWTPVHLVNDDGCWESTLGVVLVPTRETERNVCGRHTQKFIVTGRIIQASIGKLVLADVAPCDICPHLSRWDARIAEWAAAHPVEFESSVLNNEGLDSNLRPSEWAMQETYWTSRFPWDLDKMRQFLNSEREAPPKTNFMELVEEERRVGGAAAAREAIVAMSKFIARSYDRED